MKMLLKAQDSKGKQTKVKDIYDAYTIRQKIDESIGILHDRIIIWKHKNNLNDSDIKRMLILGMNNECWKKIENMEYKTHQQKK